MMWILGVLSFFSVMKFKLEKKKKKDMDKYLHKRTRRRRREGERNGKEGRETVVYLERKQVQKSSESAKRGQKILHLSSLALSLALLVKFHVRQQK